MMGAAMHILPCLLLAGVLGWIVVSTIVAAIPVGIGLPQSRCWWTRYASGGSDDRAGAYRLDRQGRRAPSPWASTVVATRAFGDWHRFCGHTSRRTRVLRKLAQRIERELAWLEVAAMSVGTVRP